MGGCQRTYGSTALQLTSLVSRLTGDAFFFAAHDDGVDIAVVAAAGSLIAMRVRFEAYLVDFADGVFHVTPRIFEEDPDFSYTETGVTALNGIAGVRVNAPVTVESGEAFYGAARELWPAGAGDPVELLRIGTWEPFENLDREYQEVFSRPCAGNAPPMSDFLSG